MNVSAPTVVLSTSSVVSIRFLTISVNILSVNDFAKPSEITIRDSSNDCVNQQQITPDEIRSSLLLNQIK